MSSGAGDDLKVCEEVYRELLGERDPLRSDLHDAIARFGTQADEQERTPPRRGRVHVPADRPSLRVEARNRLRVGRA